MLCSAVCEGSSTKRTNNRDEMFEPISKRTRSRGANAIELYQQRAAFSRLVPHTDSVKNIDEPASDEDIRTTAVKALV